MTRQVIARGSAANDGSGDTLRAASAKINDNFAELYEFLGGDSDVLSAQISLEDSAIVFEGSSTNDFETRLAVVDPTADNVVLIPDAGGYVVVDGATQTLSNKTLNLPTLTNPTINGDFYSTDFAIELLKFTHAGSSATNEITIHNATSGNPPKIVAGGSSDTNVNLKLEGKSRGAVHVKRLAFETTTLNTGGTYNFTQSHVSLTGGEYTVTLNDGITSGDVVVFTNGTSDNKTITPSNFAPAGVTNIELGEGDAVTLLWNGTNWFITGHYGASVS